MRRIIFFSLSLCAVLWTPVPAASAASAANETELIAVLQSASSSPRQKSEACAQLKRAGTERCVKVLAASLTDDKLSHSARYALESLPGPAAGKALREALGQTSGALQVGVIDSLAVRHEIDAIPDLGKLLSSPDQTVAMASAEALGRIDGPAALKLLQTSISISTGPLHLAEADAILTSAQRLLEAGHKAEALKLFETLYADKKADYVRQAAFGGMIEASGKRGIAMAVDAIASGDAASQSAALHVASQLKGAEATRMLADLATRTKGPVQLALIECLVQRGDPVALPSITTLAGSTDDAARVAAISALGSLGDDSVVPLLAERAASGAGPERDAARQSLLELSRGQVTRRMMGLISPGEPGMESELIRALGGRGDQSATPKLLELARRGNKNERDASLQALEQLAGAGQISALVELVADASSEEARSEAVGVLDAVLQQVPGKDGNPGMDALVKAVATGGTETRLALLPICSELSQKPVREALRAAVADSDTRVRDAAIHAVCETHDPELLPDLLELAGGKSGDTIRHLAVRGCVRLMTQEEGVTFSNAEKLGALEQILLGQLDAGEKRLVLSGLSGIADQRALTLAAGQLDDPEVRTEAEQAVIHIAAAIRKAHPTEAGAALKRVLALSTDSATQKSARTVLDKIH